MERSPLLSKLSSNFLFPFDNNLVLHFHQQLQVLLNNLCTFYQECDLTHECDLTLTVCGHESQSTDAGKPDAHIMKFTSEHKHAITNDAHVMEVRKKWIKSG
jgi:hypothetical protein